MIHKLIIQPETTFEDAIRLLDQNGNGFLPIIDEDNHLIGILTDGDIRRAILNKETDLERIINTNPTTVSDDLSRPQAIQMLKSIHRRHLPVVDAENHLVDVIILDDLEFNLKKNKVVIMAGGKGTRLGHLTKNTPKPMLPVGGKPMLELLINSFLDFGFNDFYISINYKAEQIREYFGDGSRFGASIRYLEEEKPLGTAGSLKLIQEPLEEPMIVINGDILTSLNFADMVRYHESNQASATMCIKEIENQIQYAIIETQENQIRDIREKPVQRFDINSGIYVIDPATLNYIPENEFYDMPTLFEQCLANRDKVMAFKLEGYWLDIGQIKDYENANAQYRFLI